MPSLAGRSHKGAGTHEFDAARREEDDRVCARNRQCTWKARFLGMLDNLVCMNLLMDLEFRWFKRVKVEARTAKATRGRMRKRGTSPTNLTAPISRGTVRLIFDTSNHGQRQKTCAHERRGRLGRCDRATTSFPSGAHSNVHGSDRVAQANAHGQHFACPHRNEFANHVPLLRRDHSGLALQIWMAAYIRSSARLAGTSESKVVITTTIYNRPCAVRGFGRTHFLPFTRSDRESRTKLHLLNIWNYNIEDSILTFCHFDICFYFLLLAIELHSRCPDVFAS